MEDERKQLQASPRNAEDQSGRSGSSGVPGRRAYTRRSHQATIAQQMQMLTNLFSENIRQRMEETKQISQSLSQVAHVLAAVLAPANGSRWAQGLVGRGSPHRARRVRRRLRRREAEGAYSDDDDREGADLEWEGARLSSMGEDDVHSQAREPGDVSSDGLSSSDLLGDVPGMP